MPVRRCCLSPVVLLTSDLPLCWAAWYRCVKVHNPRAGDEACGPRLSHAAFGLVSLRVCCTGQHAPPTLGFGACRRPSSCPPCLLPLFTELRSDSMQDGRVFRCVPPPGGVSSGCNSPPALNVVVEAVSVSAGVSHVLRLSSTSQKSVAKRVTGYALCPLIEMANQVRTSRVYEE